MRTIRRGSALRQSAQSAGKTRSYLRRLAGSSRVRIAASGAPTGKELALVRVLAKQQIERAQASGVRAGVVTAPKSAMRVVIP